MPPIVIRICGIYKVWRSSVSLCRGILQIVDGGITEHHQSNLNDFVTSESVSFSL